MLYSSSSTPYLIPAWTSRCPPLCCCWRTWWARCTPPWAASPRHPCLGVRPIRKILGQKCFKWFQAVCKSRLPPTFVNTIILPCLSKSYLIGSNFPLNPHSRQLGCWSVGWLNGLSEIPTTAGKLHFQRSHRSTWQSMHLFSKVLRNPSFSTSS